MSEQPTDVAATIGQQLLQILDPQLLTNAFDVKTLLKAKHLNSEAKKQKRRKAKAAYDKTHHDKIISDKRQARKSATEQLKNLHQALECSCCKLAFCTAAAAKPTKLKINSILSEISQRLARFNKNFIPLHVERKV